MGRADEFYGSGADNPSAGLEKMFPSGGLSASVPWDRASRTKSRPQVGDRDLIAKELVQPPRDRDSLTAFDPRKLVANQSSVMRPYVSHYMTDEYERSGVPLHDKEEIGNQQPLVYRRPSSRNPGTTEDVIMSGHHRAAAALLQGRQFRARLVEGP